MPRLSCHPQLLPTALLLSATDGSPGDRGVAVLVRQGPVAGMDVRHIKQSSKVGYKGRLPWVSKDWQDLNPVPDWLPAPHEVEELDLTLFPLRHAAGSMPSCVRYL